MHIFATMPASVLIIYAAEYDPMAVLEEIKEVLLV